MRIQNADMLTCHGNQKGRRDIVEILSAGLDLVDPYVGTKKLVSRRGSILTFSGEEYELKGDPRSGPAVYDLKNFDRVIVVGAAKGVQRCALALEEILGDYLTGGHVIGKHGDELLCKKIGVTLAGHPVPDAYSVEGSKNIYAWSKNVTERDLVITIMGSGVSSLMTWPVDGVTLAELQRLTQIMQIEKGALTSELNYIRNHLDRLKGGKISRLFSRATLVHLCTNDIGGSSNVKPGVRRTYTQVMQRNFFLATLADGGTFQDAIDTIDKYDAWDSLPASITSYLRSAPPEDETVKQAEYEAMNARVFGLTPKMTTVYPAVKRKAEELGYKALMLSECITAEARETGKVLASIALNIESMAEPVAAPCALISSGELIVTVGKETGIGGRNQEFCVAAANAISGSDRIVIGAVDTDGTDGPGGFKAPGAPPCLSGAIVDGYTAAEAAEKKVDLHGALKTHATSQPLWELGCGIAATQSISALDLRVIVIQAPK